MMGAAALLAGVAQPQAALAGLKDYAVTADTDILEVNVTMGTEDGEFIFNPSTIELVQGKLTKLNLTNPSQVTHYFTALEFADKVYSILVLAGDPAVEVKGGIKEVALKAGAKATWILIPIKPGKYPLRCTVKGHDAMVGQVIVKKADVEAPPA
ncbi:hypothetical protein HYH03_005996 [Edaphochlamys debaryana]|uniref:EfeO-type cupredoxin-like domain-containing protein n=1 Tax=Edaphochlamys debaryana TaxID=47281 RepID=A0A836C1X8_9CHLO|nr:hypothetical protein HYH03_005996 [Edaphochlamys debaryana]|eukprot:KAG2496078.1 hypothetical protein HYH03_005996 [Edaphochlamys debaryana]